jgi:DNA-binding NtrC family response regulator
MKSRRLVIRHPRKKEPVVWVIDSEQWPRACLRAELIENGDDAYGFITISDALESLSQATSPKPELIVIELRGQQLTGELVEAIQNLHVPTVALGGSVELNDPLVQQHQWRAVLKRPVSLGHIAEVVRKVLSNAQEPSEAAM